VFKSSKRKNQIGRTGVRFIDPCWAALAILATLVVHPHAGSAQTEPYPTKPVRLISDSAAGSATDASARILADKLSAIWGQQVLVMNQPGAGGGISARVAAQSAPDGYTLYMPATSPFLALPGGPGVAPNLPLELPRDFAPIGYVLQQPLFIGASHKSGIASIDELITHAQRRSPARSTTPPQGVAGSRI
jgi:tripartite-type tricarboxylate transporter receptor subunit TctC